MKFILPPYDKLTRNQLIICQVAQFTHRKLIPIVKGNRPRVTVKDVIIPSRPEPVSITVEIVNDDDFGVIIKHNDGTTAFYEIESKLAASIWGVKL